MATISEALRLALQHLQSGRHSMAEQIYLDILRSNPRQPDALHLLGVIAGRSEKGRDRAVELMSQAISVRPRSPVIQNNLGNVLKAQGKLERAVACYRQALSINPSFAEAYINLGAALLEQRKLDAAVVSLQNAIRLNPSLIEAHNNLGICYKGQGKLDLAVACYRHALQLSPQSAEAHNNLGNALKAQGQLMPAAECYRRALELKANYVAPHSNLLMCLNYDPDATPDDVFAEHVRWGEWHGQSAQENVSHVNDPDPDRILRVGYISRDFRRHAVAFFVEPILANHDPAQVRSICYADVPNPDLVTRRLQKLSHDWRDTYGTPHDEVAGLIHEDCIDILVDLGGHTAHNRLPVLARKPAPVQVTYLGYPHTTGLTTVDYRLTDDITDPPGEPARHTEQLVRLSGGFCSYAPPADAPNVTPLPALSRGYVTFGSLHKLERLTNAVIETWCRILQCSPSFRLLICRNTLAGGTRDELAAKFRDHGIEAEQLELRHTNLSGGQHLEAYSLIDISLDTFPWSGHTTACESLWMGAPMITLRGRVFAGRMVASVLNRLGLQECIAGTPQDYVRLAAELAGDLDRLAAIRSGMRNVMRHSLCDGASFTRTLEDAYRGVWQSWCRSRTG